MSLSALEGYAGPQLAIVRYSSTHSVFDEWVYNAAEIDKAKVVWAREMDAPNDAELLRYFSNRRVWLVEPDSSPPRISPYELSPPAAGPDDREYPGRARAAITIILLMSALAVCTLASLLPGSSDGTLGIRAESSWTKTRFAGMRAILPPRGTVGYLSDTGGRQKTPKAYYLTQYFLAPVVVAPDIGA